MAKFPTPEWTQVLMEKLNTDEHYGHVARNWEGDILVVVEGVGETSRDVPIYIDLWHGKCRDAYLVEGPVTIKPAFILRSPYANFSSILKGELDVLQALITRKLAVQGNLAVLMRQVPTVLDFVRCCREVTDSFE